MMILNDRIKERRGRFASLWVEGEKIWDNDFFSIFRNTHDESTWFSLKDKNNRIEAQFTDMRASLVSKNDTCMIEELHGKYTFHKDSYIGNTFIKCINEIPGWSYLMPITPIPGPYDTMEFWIYEDNELKKLFEYKKGSPLIRREIYNKEVGTAVCFTGEGASPITVGSALLESEYTSNSTFILQGEMYYSEEYGDYMIGNLVADRTESIAHDEYPTKIGFVEGYKPELARELIEETTPTATPVPIPPIGDILGCLAYRITSGKPIPRISGLFGEEEPGYLIFRITCLRDIFERGY